MFKEYILNKPKESSKTQKTFISESLDPLKTLRDFGIRIKKSVPHKEGYEISLFVNPNDLDLKRILRGFNFFVKDDKIFVKF